MHVDGVDDVVAHALVVPGLLGRLAVAGGVRGSATEDVLARRRIPGGSPPVPGELARGFLDLRRCPNAVDAEIHMRDCSESGPRPATDLHAAPADRALAREEIRKARQFRKSCIETLQNVLRIL